MFQIRLFKSLLVASVFSSFVVALVDLLQSNKLQYCETASSVVTLYFSNHIRYGFLPVFFISLVVGYVALYLLLGFKKYNLKNLILATLLIPLLLTYFMYFSFANVAVILKAMVGSFTTGLVFYFTYNKI